MNKKIVGPSYMLASEGMTLSRSATMLEGAVTMGTAGMQKFYRDAVAEALKRCAHALEMYDAAVEKDQTNGS